jgi:hypothetical protein
VSTAFKHIGAEKYLECFTNGETCITKFNDHHCSRYSDDSVGRMSGCHCAIHVSAHSIHMQNVAVVIKTTDRLRATKTTNQEMNEKKFNQ